MRERYGPPPNRCTVRSAITLIRGSSARSACSRITRYSILYQRHAKLEAWQAQRQCLAEPELCGVLTGSNQHDRQLGELRTLSDEQLPCAPCIDMNIGRRSSRELDPMFGMK